MASVQELILAAQAKQKKSPLSSLGELISAGTQGYSQGVALNQARLETSLKLVQLDQARKDMENQDKMQKVFEEEQGLNREKTLRTAQAAAGTPDTPTTPAQKFETTWSQDEKGKLSRTIKPVQDATKDFIGMDKDGNVVLKDSKSGELIVKSVPGGKLQPKPSAAGGGYNTDYSLASPGDQEMAKAMVEGRIQTSALGYRDRGRLTALANDYAVKNGLDYRSYGSDVKAGMAKNLAYGKMGFNSLSLNTALGHVDDAVRAYENVKNTDQAWLNTPINKLKEQTNDPNVVALGINLNALQGELATVFKGTSGTDQEIGKWEKYLNEDLTPAQYYGAAEKVGELLTSRLGALQYQQENVMKEGVQNRNLVSPKGRKTLEHVREKGAASRGESTIPKIGDEVDGYVFQGGDPSQQGSWRKK